jgi:hypothetical protein
MNDDYNKKIVPMHYIETAQQNKIVEQNFPNKRNKVLFMSEQKKSWN